MDEVDEQGNVIGSFTPSDLTVGLNLASDFQGGVSLGGRLRGTQQNIKESGQLSTTGDLGVMWKGRAYPVSLGIQYSNFGSTNAGFAPSAALKIGAAYELRLAEKYGATLMLQGTGLNSGGQRLHAGVETRMSDWAWARLGYQVAMLDQQLGGLSGLSAGLGLRIGFIQADYAYLPYGHVGESHRLSVSLVFVDETPQAPTVVSAAPASAKPRAPKPALAAPVQDQSPPAKAGESMDLVFEVGDKPGAKESELIQATQDHPKDPLVWRALGNHYFSTKNRPAMISAFEKALELDPSDAKLKGWLDRVKNSSSGVK
jgi:hypothetical protein